MSMMNAGREHLLSGNSDFAGSTRRKLEGAIDGIWLLSQGAAMRDLPNHCMRGELDGGRPGGPSNGWRER
jgi:hypothetical protein